MLIYVVKPGDSIYSIARAHGVSPEKIIADNELSNPAQLSVGQALVIVNQGTTYTVKSGDTVYSIAQAHGVSVAAILRANPSIGAGARIYPGQTLVIPVRSQPMGTIEVNGYAFPSIPSDILAKTLPSLTYLSLFSYTVNSDGSLNTINDQRAIQEARTARVAPIMVITNMKEGSGFNSDIAHDVLTNEEAQNTLIENIVSTLKSKNYYGLNIDFEYVYPYDRESYNNFVRKITTRLNSLNYVVMTALAPKISADQPGLLYEAHDYPAHGATVNRVILMTYEWGYMGGPPLPVAPLNEVRRVLDYAVTAIPPEKILMGIPNYGYDWKLPYVRGTKAEVLDTVEASERAFEKGAAIEYDTVAQSPFYRYYENGVEHIVWFEDARSIQAKLRLVQEYGLAGVSYWTISQYFPQNWLVLNSMFTVKKVL